MPAVVDLAPGQGFTLPDGRIGFLGWSISIGCIVPRRCFVTFDRLREASIIKVELVTEGPQEEPQAIFTFIPRPRQLYPALETFAFETYRRRAIAMAAVPRDDPATNRFGDSYREVFPSLPRRRQPRINQLELTYEIHSESDPVRVVEEPPDVRPDTATVQT